MPNTFLTVKNIARKALPILQNMLVMPNLISRDYNDAFAKKGDTIQVKRPAVYVADEFGSTINLQDINPFPVLVTMDKIADVSTEVTAKEMALNMDSFEELVLNPAVVAIAEKINADGLNLYKYVPTFGGISGTTPSGLEDFANARKRLNNQKCPMVTRRAIWDPDADAKFSILDAIVNTEKSGSTQALREGSIGRIQGLDNYMSQAVKTHTAGGFAGLADVSATVNISGNTRDTITNFMYSVATLESAAGMSTAKLLQGDIMTIDGVQYTVLEDTADAAAGVISSVKLFPALSADIASQAVTFADASAAAHVANMAFHKDAFTFVTRPLEPAVGTQSYTTTFNGISMRVTMDYDIKTKKTIMSIDVLYGYASLYPEALATRILG